MKLNSCYVMFFLIFFCSEVFCTEFTKTFFYEPQVSKIEGIIKSETKFGPPNYGETPNIDKKISYYYILLKNKINVKGNINDPLNSDSYKNIKKIQIVNINNKKIINYLNKRVIVTGKLFQAQTGYHFTRVLITLISVSTF